MPREGIARRDFLTGVAAAGAGALAAAAQAPGSAAEQIVVTDPGGDWQRAAIAGYYTPFEKSTGIKVVYGPRPSLAVGKIKAMVEAKNVEWDVTDLSDYLMYQAAQLGLLEKIEYDRGATKDLIKGAAFDYGVGLDVYSTNFAYNTQKWPAGAGPNSWADFWNVKKFPGKRAMIGVGYGPLEAALMADGVPMNKVYPLDVNRALKKMDELRPYITVWATTGAQMEELIHGGDIDLMHAWVSRLQTPIEEGAPYHFVWNQGYYQFEGWVIPKGAPNHGAANKFVNWCLTAKAQAEWAARNLAGPTNSTALPMIPADRAKLLPTYKPNLDKMLRVDAPWVAANADALQGAWTKWMAK